MRRAQFNWTVVLIIALAVLIVMLMFASRISNLLSSQTDKNACKASIYKHAIGRIKILDIATDLNCPTSDVTISGENAKKQLATEMYDCWDKFGQGKLTLFDRDDIYCVICSRIDFDDKAKLENFAQYLNEQQIPGKEITYLEYLQGFETPRAREVVGQINQQLVNVNTIDAQKRYATIFVYARGEDKVRQIIDLTLNTGRATTFPYMIAGGIMMVAGGALATTGLGMIPGSILIYTGKGVWTAAGAAALFEGYFRTDSKPDHIAFVALREYSQEELDSLGCKYLPSKQK
jgi:hypothetical protein